MIVYRWFEDMSEREIADALGVRPGTVEVTAVPARWPASAASSSELEVLAHD